MLYDDLEKNQSRVVLSRGPPRGFEPIYSRASSLTSVARHCIYSHRPWDHFNRLACQLCAAPGCPRVAAGLFSFLTRASVAAFAMLLFSSADVRYLLVRTGVDASLLPLLRRATLAATSTYPLPSALPAVGHVSIP
ncbi:hypothetical protein AMTR_s00080p00170570 [Amborella trichopoda]|uniref:Uncharacterized protein n=1 Tax=Amborella trichopoda TaxID=13333 RepID=W1PB88_AMBTC|nr:hypothetical protein AMTR_s00080p00170570 [Amborella trichopoda]